VHNNNNNIGTQTFGPINSIAYIGLDFVSDLGQNLTLATGHPRARESCLHSSVLRTIYKRTTRKNYGVFWGGCPFSDTKTDDNTIPEK